MKLLRTLKRWSVRSLGMAVLASAFFAGPDVLAQSGLPQSGPQSSGTLPGGGMPPLRYSKNTSFRLPVDMTEPMRANLREVCLYLKIGTGDWVRHETGLPSLKHFDYKAQRDGEHWFSLVTVDKNGRMSPSDVSQEPPSLRVVVDTQAPVLNVQPSAGPDGELILRCQVQDANPDISSVKAFYQTEAGDKALQPVAGQPGAFKLPPPDKMVQTVKVIASDLSGNLASREVNVRDLALASLQNTKTATQGNLPPVPATPVSRPDVPTIPPVAKGPELPDPGKTIGSLPTDPQKPALPPLPNMSGATGSTHVANSIPTIPSTPVAPLPPVASNPVTTTPQTGPTNSVPFNPPLPNTPATGQTAPSLPSNPPFPGTTPASAIAVEGTPKVGAPGVPRQVINTTHATLDYRIDQVGPSGVGKVEVYLTGDAGQTWQRLAEDTDRRSPANLDLPGEGLFGVRLVITNGNGFGGTPPARGEAPTCWVEVDTTVPFIQLRPIDPAQNGVLEIRWTASDKNLGGEPVNLLFRTRPDSQWLPIARNVKNDGLYRWTFPRDQGSQFFVKAEVVDQAGNVARAETPNPIVLDITEPRASVVGVTGMSGRATAPLGN